jgi:choline dehydrogenase-like flavoprotein
MPTPTYDVIIIGSGFGGTFAAAGLVDRGLRVLMLERGRRVTRGPENWEPSAAAQLSEHYSESTPYHVTDDHGQGTTGGFFCLGGPSVFYGGVSLRYRERDFSPHADVTGDSGAQWPFAYDELEPWYTRAEQMIGVAGRAGEDPTEPPRSAGYAAPPRPLAPISERLARAASELGYHPFRLPLAINYGGDGRNPCIECATCDGFPCAIEAKNDLATAVLPSLVSRGLEVRTGVAVTRLEMVEGRVSRVEVVDVASGARETLSARHYILAAGAIATPHLLLASGLHELSPARDAVGGYLMRHCNRIVFGLFLKRPDPEGRHHKQIGIHDLYNDAGGLQQLVTPPVSLVRAQILKAIGPIAARLVPHITGFLAIAEDQPQRENRITIDAGRRDALGMPVAMIRHHYSERDERAVATLATAGKRILRAAGAVAFYRHRIWTFSHAIGTVRMGDDPSRAPLDARGRFRGLSNLSVTDASALPTSASVNPSLTIAATAYRAGTLLAGELSHTRHSADISIA